MIEYYGCKKIWLKAMAVFLIISFVWYDIAWAGDLFYMPSINKTQFAQTAQTAQIAHESGDDKTVTNYDLMDRGKKGSTQGSLLP